MGFDSGGSIRAGRQAAGEEAGDVGCGSSEGVHAEGERPSDRRADICLMVLMLIMIGRNPGSWVSTGTEVINGRWNPRAFGGETQGFDKSQKRRRNAADRMKDAGR